jgi:hypothetical protein
VGVAWGRGSAVTAAGGWNAKIIEEFRANQGKVGGKQKEIMPGFAEYERKTTRKIPVVVLERID